MVKRILFVQAMGAIFIACLCPAVLGKGTTDSQHRLFLSIQQHYANIQSLKVNFAQEMTNAASHETEKRSGVIYFKRPYQIRWETLQPDREILIIHKKGIVWDVYPEDRSAYKYFLDQKFNSKKLIKIITGQIELNKEFNILSTDEDQGLKKIKLVPKVPEPDLVLAYVWIDEQQVLIRKILLIDFYGNGNFLDFQKITIDQNLPDSLFDFQIPKGYQLIDNTAGSD